MREKNEKRGAKRVKKKSKRDQNALIKMKKEQNA